MEIWHEEVLVFETALTNLNEGPSSNLCPVQKSVKTFVNEHLNCDNYFNHLVRLVFQAFKVTANE